MTYRSHMQRGVGGTQGRADADAMVSKNSDAVFPRRLWAWRCVAAGSRVETVAHLWRAATRLLASARGGLADAVHFWRGVLDVSLGLQRLTAAQ